MATTTTPLPFPVPRARRGSGTQVDPDLDRARRIARVLDQRFVDPILGFVLPGVGDLVGSLVGLYTVYLAIQRRVSPVVVARMLLNLVLDAALGVIPFVGDLFDLGFRANTRNVALLAERTEAGGRATRRDWLAVVGAAVAFGVVIGVTIYAVVALVRAIV